MEQLSRYFHDVEIKTIIDAGTGSGEFISVLKPVFPNARFTGVDPSEKALESAKAAFPDAAFYPMAIENLEFEDCSFDLASISMALHHLPKVKKGLKELLRVVRQDGWFIISELYSDNLNPAQEVQKMYHHFRSYTDRLQGISHRETFKREEIIQIVKDAGISAQFIFDWRKEPVTPFGKPEIEMRAKQMEDMLLQISNFPDEVKKLKPLTESFRAKAAESGWQPATNVVIVGRKK